jgi:subtilase family serine protease
MKMTVALFQQRQPRPRLRLWCAITALALTAGPLVAQGPAVRIPAEINSTEQSVLPGSKHPLALTQLDAGRVPPGTRMTDVTIFFKRSAAQEANLQTLIKAQQTPGSPQFHQWLTPDQFAARFGVAEADLQKVQGWLEQQGFAVNSISRSHNAIHFSGTAGTVEQAFSTQMHYYNMAGVKHIAPSTALSVPNAIAPMVSGVLNLDDFKPRAMHTRGRPVNVKPQYSVCGDTTCTTANQFVLFAPGDIKVAYDINPLIGAGNNGSGQTIAIMGQSAIQDVDIENFQQAASLTVKDPAMTLVPNTGSSTISPGDESESDLDVEWSGATAPGANINFVYTGPSSNLGVYQSYEYAVDNNIGNVISISYGTCETDLSQSQFTTMESWGEQAVTQGQTVVAASGDSGATACYGYTNLTSAQQGAAVVSYPASSAFVTGVGGTEISTADDVVGQYWSPATVSGGSILLTSALSYIPEIAWNDDTVNITSPNNPDCAASFSCLSASGGGISSLTAQPAWQTSYFTATGETNPSSQFRLVPDIGLYASPNYPGYLYCTSDTTSWQSGQTASCGSSQFFDPTTGDFTVAGGTSFAAPIFAGELAILNQAKNYTTGQGLANTQLYTLAANSSTYGTAFNDVTSGSNACTGSSSCPSTNGYSAGTGYDMVTGLGSLNLNTLVTAWPENTSTIVGTTTTITPTNTSPVVNTSDTFTISVSASAGTTVPTGSVNVSIDGGTATSYPLTTSGSAATYSLAYTFTTIGSHTITASYPANSAFGASTGSTTVNVQNTNSGTGTFTLAFNPSTLTVSQGSSGQAPLILTPAGGYTGTVVLSFSSSNATALENLCVEAGSGLTNGNFVVSGTSAVTGNIMLDTNAADCATTAAVAALAKRGLHVIPHAGKTATTTANNSNRGALPAGLAMAGLLLAGFLGRSSRKLRGLACVIALAAIGLGLTACGSSNTNNTVPDPPKGTYTITFTGNDSATANITANSVPPLTFTIN